MRFYLFFKNSPFTAQGKKGDWENIRVTQGKILI